MIRSFQRAYLAALLLALSVLGEEGRVDAYGDPLPEHVVARLGTMRLRHPDHCRQVAFSPDSRLLASIGYGSVQVWEVPSGKRVAHANVEYHFPEVIAFSQDGKSILTLSQREGVQLRNPRTAEVERELIHLGPRTSALATSLDGRICAGIGGDTISALDLSSGRSLMRVQAFLPLDRPTMALRPDGRRILTCLYGVRARMWDVEQGREIELPQERMNRAERAAWSVDGRFLALGQGDGEILLSQDERVPHRLGVLDGAIVALQFLSNGETLVAVDAKGTLARFSLASRHSTGAVFLRGYSPFTANELRYWPCVAVSQDGKFVARSGYAITLWDAESGQEVTPGRDVQGGVYNLFLSPDESRIAGCYGGGTLLMWEVIDGTRKACVHPRQVRSCCSPLGFEESGETLAVLVPHEGVAAVRASNVHERIATEPECFWRPIEMLGGRARLVVTEQFIDELVDHHAVASEPPLRFEGLDPEGLAWVEPAPDGCMLAACEALLVGDERGFGVRLWDMSTGKLLRDLCAHMSQSASIRFAPDGLKLVATDRGLELQVWDVESGTLVASLETERADLYGVPTPGGRFFVCRTETGSIVVRRLSDLEEVWRTVPDCGPIESMVFSWDGRRLYTGMADSTILVWELPSEYVDPPPPAEGSLAELYDALSSRNAWTRDRARTALIERGDEAVQELRERLMKPPADEETLARLVAQLDVDTPSEREAAHGELLRHAWLAETLLRTELAMTRSPEVRERITQILRDSFSPGKCAPEAVQRLHAIWVLERIGTESAAAALREIAGRTRVSGEIRAALAALGRLADRPERK